MKAHIRPKQAKEVTKEEFYSLFDELVDRDDWHHFHHKKMTIAKMIEILDENSYYWEIDNVDEDDGFNVIVHYEDKVTRMFTRSKLCDTLWEAVKHIIEVED